MGETRFRQLVKRVLWKFLPEHENWFPDILVEILEDYALAKAIDEEMSSGVVKHEDILTVLDDQENGGVP